MTAKIRAQALIIVIKPIDGNVMASMGELEWNGRGGRVRFNYKMFQKIMK